MLKRQIVINGFIIILNHLSYLTVTSLLMIMIHLQMQFLLQEKKKILLSILKTMAI